jgi:hypothetical protein
MRSLAKVKVTSPALPMAVASNVNKVTSPVKPSTRPWRLARKVILPKTLSAWLNTIKFKSGLGFRLLAEIRAGLKFASNWTP